MEITALACLPFSMFSWPPVILSLAAEELAHNLDAGEFCRGCGSQGLAEKARTILRVQMSTSSLCVLQTVCSYWLKGLCMKGEDCGFLHVFDPARLPVCRNLIKFGECKEPDCPFKHSLEDVKVRSPAFPKPTPPLAAIYGGLIEAAWSPTAKPHKA